MGVFILVAILFGGIIFYNSVKILREYERGVVFSLGRFWRIKGPGLILIFPFIQQMVRVELRTIVMDVPSQDVITRDNVSIRVSAVVYFRVIEPASAIIRIENYFEGTSQLAQTTLRAVLGKHELDQILSERDKLNADLQVILDTQAEPWGIKVSNVEIKHVDIDPSMIQAIAKQAEAERERRAKVIHAEGELQASVQLAEAAKVLDSQPSSMQLRYLQTLANIASGSGKTNTLIFPMPINLMAQLNKFLATGTKE